MLSDKIFIILLLQFKGRGLIHIVCRNPGIDSDALEFIALVMICMNRLGIINVMVFIHLYEMLRLHKNRGKEIYR